MSNVQGYVQSLSQHAAVGCGYKMAVSASYIRKIAPLLELPRVSIVGESAGQKAEVWGFVYKERVSPHSLLM